LLLLGETSIPDYLTWSIFNTFCCCPFGFIAIIISIFARVKKTDGDLQGARRASTVARGMNIIATIGSILMIINFIHILATDRVDPKPKL